MRPEDLQVEIRARSPGEAVALATRMFQQRPGTLSGAALCYALGIFALGHLALGILHWHWGWALALVLLLGPLFSLPVTTAAGHLVFSPRVSLHTVIGATLRRGPSFLLLFLVNRVLTVAGLVCFLVPGLYLWRASWFLGPIVALERSSLGASFRRGRRFAVGFHGRVLSHAVNAALLLIYLTVAAASLVHFLTVNIFGLTFTELTELPARASYFPYLGLIGWSLAAPFVTLAWFFVYLDVRICKEGWDLEIAFRARAARLEQSHA